MRIYPWLGQNNLAGYRDMHKKLHVSYLLGFLFLISLISLLGAHYEKNKSLPHNFPNYKSTHLTKHKSLKRKVN